MNIADVPNSDEWESSISLEPTSDESGDLNIWDFKENRWVEYNIDVAVSGKMGNHAEKHEFPLQFEGHRGFGNYYGEFCDAKRKFPAAHGAFDSVPPLENNKYPLLADS